MTNDLGGDGLLTPQNATGFRNRVAAVGLTQGWTFRCAQCGAVRRRPEDPACGCTGNVLQYQRQEGRQIVNEYVDIMLHLHQCPECYRLMADVTMRCGDVKFDDPAVHGKMGTPSGGTGWYQCGLMLDDLETVVSWQVSRSTLLQTPLKQAVKTTTPEWCWPKIMKAGDYPAEWGQMEDQELMDHISRACAPVAAGVWQGLAWMQETLRDRTARAERTAAESPERNGDE